MGNGTRDAVPAPLPHVFSGERCIHCGVNLYDDMLYGDGLCIDYPGRRSVWTFEAGRNDMADFEDMRERRLFPRP